MREISVQGMGTPEHALDKAIEDDLLRRSAAGDRLAFARLVEAHRDALTAVAGRITGDRAGAEDIVQEVFARAWTRAPEWRSDRGARYRTWLTRIAINLAIDLGRQPAPLPIVETDEPADPAPAADLRLIERERAARLAEAVSSLPARQRAAIALVYDGGLSNAEAASALETSIGAVELLLVRARRTLRTAMRTLEAE